MCIKYCGMYEESSDLYASKMWQRKLTTVKAAEKDYSDCMPIDELGRERKTLTVMPGCYYKSALNL